MKRSVHQILHLEHRTSGSRRVDFVNCQIDPGSESRKWTDISRTIWLYGEDGPRVLGGWMQWEGNRAAVNLISSIQIPINSI